MDLNCEFNKELITINEPNGKVIYLVEYKAYFEHSENVTRTASLMNCPVSSRFYKGLKLIDGHNETYGIYLEIEADKEDSYFMTTDHIHIMTSHTDEHLTSLMMNMGFGDMKIEGNKLTNLYIPRGHQLLTVYW